MDKTLVEDYAGLGKLDKNELMNMFNKYITILVNLTKTLNRKDLDLDRAVKLFNLAKSSSPQRLIIEVGPFLFQHSAHIKSRNEDFFINLNSKSVIKQDGENAEIGTKVFDIVKSMYSCRKPSEKDYIYKCVLLLHDCYILFLMKE
jgi:hypothetical protein